MVDETKLMGFTCRDASRCQNEFDGTRTRYRERETEEPTSGGNNPPRYLWQAEFGFLNGYDQITGKH
jgi:hypothetical protein